MVFLEVLEVLQVPVCLYLGKCVVCNSCSIIKCSCPSTTATAIDFTTSREPAIRSSRDILLALASIKERHPLSSPLSHGLSMSLPAIRLPSSRLWERKRHMSSYERSVEMSTSMQYMARDVPECGLFAKVRRSVGLEGKFGMFNWIFRAGGENTVYSRRFCSPR
jgi:hypothetical protein